MAIQPVTFKPIAAIKPVARKVEAQTAPKADRKRPKRGKRPGTGELVDKYV